MFGYDIRCFQPGSLSPRFRLLVKAKEEDMARAEERIKIEAPLEQVFDLFTKLERWPQWMSNVKTVMRVGEDLTQWIGVAQGGEALNWLAETITFEPHRAFAWRSVGGDLDASAQATFSASDQNTVLLRVSIEYDKAGEGIATPLGYNPAAQLGSDLKNFRRMVEQEALGDDETLAAPSAQPRVTGQLEPNFLKQNKLPDDSTGSNRIELEEAFESDFGRALENIKRRSDKVKTPVIEPPVITVAAAAAEPVAPAVATDETLPSAPPPVMPEAKRFVASLPPPKLPGPPPQQKDDQHTPFRPEPPRAVSYKQSARYIAPVYLIFALAAFLGALAGFWLASTRTAAVEATAANTTVNTDEPAAPLAEEAPAEEAGQRQAGTPSQTAVESQQQTREQGPEPLLRESLADWIATTNARDMNRLIAFYMPVVDTFYQKSKVKRAAVRAEKVRVIERADVVRIKAAQPTVKISDDGNRATMRFRKTYVIESKRNSQRGEVLQELVWQKTNTGWKIVSERDLRVIR